MPKYTKKDCFAYESLTRCKALNMEQLNCEGCSFYKTKEQNEQEGKRGEEILKSLGGK